MEKKCPAKIPWESWFLLPWEKTDSWNFKVKSMVDPYLAYCNACKIPSETLPVSSLNYETHLCACIWDVPVCSWTNYSQALHSVQFTNAQVYLSYAGGSWHHAQISFFAKPFYFLLLPFSSNAFDDHVCWAHPTALCPFTTLTMRSSQTSPASAHCCLVPKCSFSYSSLLWSSRIPESQP